MSPDNLPARVRWMSATWAAVATVVVVAALSGLATWRWQRSRAITDEGELQIDRARAVQSDLTDMETGQRGFLLTSADRYLEPYNTGLTHLNEHLKELRAGARDAERLRFVDLITDLARRKASELDSTIRMARENRHDDAIGLVKTDRGQRYMDSLRVVLADLTRAEHADQARHIDDEDRWALAVRLVLLVGTLLTLGVLLFLRRSLNAYANLQAAAVREMERQLSELETQSRALADRGTQRP